MAPRTAALVALASLVSPAGCGDDDDSSGDGDADVDAGGDGDADADGDGDADADGDADWIDPPTRTVALAPTDEVFPNPERGFYRTTSLVDGGPLDWVRDEGSTLVHSYVRLDDYRERDLDGALINAVLGGFTRARDAGVKIVLRFAYNFGPYPDSEPDASKDWVLTHIDQLEPLLVSGADVIAFQQAGFIGAWGEWHTSTNGLLDDPQDKFDILEALLAALPEERAVQIRYPPYKQEGYGGPLGPEDAWSGTPAARIGHHNDCFLASDEDWGTYPAGEIEEWKDFVAAETLWVPMGGETCNPNPPRSDCASALAEMERLHWTYVNDEYHPEVVAGWTDQGCREEMERRLGYRLVALDVDAPEAARPGGTLPFVVRLQNEGFAPPANPRAVWVVLDGPRFLTAVLADPDARAWLPGEEATIRTRLQLPADLPEGEYTIGLWLPDAAEALRDDPRFAIRLANDASWDAATGANRLTSVTIAADAPGSRDPDAAAFAERP